MLIGGTGFVGRALVARLNSIYKEIYVIARHRYDWAGCNNIQSFEASLDDAVLLKKILPRCRVVFHLASETTPGASAMQPSLEAASNLLPSLRFLEVLQKYQHVNLVYVSSGGAVYGDSSFVHATEDIALSPLSYYGAGKAALEKFILAFCKQTGGRAVILRPSNIYGPDQPYREGFGIIPTIFYHILTQKSMQVWGDGETVRDYLYIDDFVECCIELSVGCRFKKRATIYNIGSGLGTSINELCLLAENITNKPLCLEYEPARIVDVKNIVLDCSRIRKDYNWHSVINLPRGLTRTWKWFCTQQSI